MGALDSTIDNWWNNLTRDQQLSIFTEYRNSFIAGDDYEQSQLSKDAIEKIRHKRVWDQDRFIRKEFDEPDHK